MFPTFLKGLRINKLYVNDQALIIYNSLLLSVLCQSRLGCYFCFGFVAGLLARFEWKRFAELNSHPAYIAVYMIHPTNMAPTCEICHVERIVRTISRHTETCGNMLPRIRTTIMCITGKRCPFAANIDHLSLGRGMVDILSEPDWPIITQSLLCSSITVFVHC
jgi:hypothetical protein